MKKLFATATPHYAWIQASYWMAYCILFSFSSLYLLDRGLTNGEIGLLLGLAGALASLLQPWVGARGDRLRRLSLGQFAGALVAAMGLCAVGLLLFPGKGAQAGLYLGLLVLLHLLAPLLYALGMDCVNNQVPLNFGLARGMGGMSFALVSGLCGWVTALAGPGVIPVLLLLAGGMLGVGAATFRRGGPVDRGVWCDGEAVYVQGEKLLEVSRIKIPGWHNVENYMAAIAAVWGDVGPQTIRQVAETFAGVEHRAEFVRELGGVKYYNDSIATSPTRVISGMLSLFPQKIVMIAGGYDKHIPFEPLGPAVCDKVKTLILLGATAQKIQDAVTAAPQYRKGNPEILRVETMEQAVEAAAAHAQPGDIVSLSPACAAFDLYPNFEVRGRHFKEIVNKL